MGRQAVQQIVRRVAGTSRIYHGFNITGAKLADHHSAAAEITAVGGHFG
jgi:hypothetical protein